MSVHITKTYNIGGLIGLRQNAVKNAGETLGFKEMSLFKFPDAYDSDDELHVRMDGIIASLCPEDIVIFQHPSGESPRYDGFLFDHLRRLYGRLSDQYSAGDFSYNTGKLRCPVCEGTGTISMDIQFLPDIEMTCEHCDGTRYSNDVDSIMYHGYSIKDVMSLTILESLDVFKDIKKIKEKLQVLVDLGIGYLTLGEATPALSGGEAQRLKLASEIGKVQDGSIFIFDEPSIGLHPLDVETLLRVFDTLINQKATIIVIEHDLDVIRNSDYIIDMGPEGGQLGGEIIAMGTVEEIKQNKNSKIGKYL